MLSLECLKIIGLTKWSLILLIWGEKITKKADNLPHEKKKSIEYLYHYVKNVFFLIIFNVLFLFAFCKKDIYIFIYFIIFVVIFLLNNFIFQ